MTDDCIQQKSKTSKIKDFGGLLETEGLKKISEHTKEDCIFCKIAKGDIPCNKVYEDDKTLAFLDISPVSKGHTLVIPKEHAEKIYELSDESSEALAKTLKKISKAVEKALGCDFNVLNNNGEKAGQLVKHVHFHIIPKQDDTGFEYNWDSKKYEEDEDKEILEKIKTNLQF